MKVEATQDVDPGKPLLVEQAIRVTVRLNEARSLEEDIGRVLDALQEALVGDELEEELKPGDEGYVLQQSRIRLAELSSLLAVALARVPSDRPTDVDENGRPTLPAGVEEEPSGRPASLPGGELPRYLDIVASHIDPANREFTVRVYQCDHVERRRPNETLARTFPDEAAARKFYGSTQNVWNMRVRAGDAPAYDVALGVQDKRKHAKKKSHREVEHVLCKGGPG